MSLLEQELKQKEVKFKSQEQVLSLVVEEPLEESLAVVSLWEDLHL
jgi:hypothetical protein